MGPIILCVRKDEGRVTLHVPTATSIVNCFTYVPRDAKAQPSHMAPPRPCNDEFHLQLPSCRTTHDSKHCKWVPSLIVSFPVPNHTFVCTLIIIVIKGLLLLFERFSILLACFVRSSQSERTILQFRFLTTSSHSRRGGLQNADILAYRGWHISRDPGNAPTQSIVASLALTECLAGANMWGKFRNPLKRAIRNASVCMLK